MNDYCCEPCTAYTRSTRRRIAAILAVLLIGLVCYALYRMTGQPGIAAAVLWPLGAPYADRLAEGWS